MSDGVLVWAEPRHPHASLSRDVRFKITVALPTSVQVYKDFSTDLPLFKPNTSFEVIRLKSPNATIEYGVGHRHSLNAEILAEEIIWGEADGAEAQVHLKTSNGAISIWLAMGSGYKHNTLRMVAQTLRAVLDLKVWETLGTRLFLEAATSAALAALVMHPDSRYEGIYDLRTDRRAPRSLQSTWPWMIHQARGDSGPTESWAPENPQPDPPRREERPKVGDERRGLCFGLSKLVNFFLYF
ncbi:hypothetical protein FB451DRAFT_1399445 [Mycena latifolia]|nr:hypothetical protein FB451DRAFT_1399445 [Mycena latifolia]